MIYGLVDPRTLAVRYVGASSSGLLRPKQHRSMSSREKTHKARWIRALRQAGFEYTIVVLEEVSGDTDLDDTERWWIAFGRACGWPLTNLTDGGAGKRGCKHSAETREKIAAVHRGRVRPDIVAMNKRVVYDEATREKRRQAARARWDRRV